MSNDKYMISCSAAGVQKEMQLIPLLDAVQENRRAAMQHLFSISFLSKMCVYETINCLRISESKKTSSHMMGRETEFRDLTRDKLHLIDI